MMTNKLPIMAAGAVLIAALANPPATRALTINATFDSTITSDPNASTIEATINSAIAVYEARFTDPITIAFDFKESTSGLAGSSTYTTTVAYSDYLTALTNHVTSADDATAVNHLPVTTDNPVNGNASITLKDPLARALGFSANPPQYDSIISLNISVMNISSSNPDPNKYSLFAAVSHEMDEGMAFGGALNGLDNGGTPPTDSSVEPEDFFRFAPDGTRSYTTSAAAIANCCFDGSTLIEIFNQDSGGVKADFADWASGDVPHVQDAYGTPGAFPTLDVELRVLDAIGLTLGSAAATWLDFHYTGTSVGTYTEPYSTLADATNGGVPSGGILDIDAFAQPSTSSETLTISSPMTINSVGGASTIGVQ
jgi:hypothetical protein